MAKLFYEGNPISMGILSILLLIILAIAVYRAIQISKDKVPHETTFRHELAKIKSVGLFAFIFGIFAQLAGIYRALSALEAAQSIPTAVIITGVRISLIPILYGAIIFLLSYLIWFGLDTRLNRLSSSD